MNTLTPKEVRALWADDLENGGHKQGTGQLYNAVTDGWCCLGRLEQLAVDHGVIDSDDFDGSRVCPSRAAGYWAGLSTKMGNFDDTSLAELNDNEFTFAEIAAIIRSEPDGLCAT